MTNSPARSEQIQKAIKDIAALESERKGIGEQIRGIKQTVVKGDLGMKISDFNAAMRLYGLEGDDRTMFFDTLRETFEALGVGETLNFMDALDPVDADTDEGFHDPAPEAA